VRAATKAVQDVLAEIRCTRGAKTIEDKISTVKHVFSLQGEKMAEKA